MGPNPIVGSRQDFSAPLSRASKDEVTLVHLKSQREAYSNPPAGGQRSKIIPPYYAIKKNIEVNQLIVGFGKETEVREFGIKDTNWINPELQIDKLSNCELWVRVRHGGTLIKCKDQNNLKSETV